MSVSGQPAAVTDDPGSPSPRMRRDRAIIYSVAVLIGAVAIIGPRNLAWTGGYVVGPALEYTIGDHIQTTYHLWLWWDALTTLGHLPWVDPYRFALISDTTIFQASGWPLILIAFPIQLIADSVAAYNVIQVTAFLTAAWCMYLFVTEFGVAWWSGAVAGFAYAFAPLRLVQGGHANSLLAFLLPLTLFFVERALRGQDERSRRWAWLAVASHLSLIASGEFHLALYGSGLLLVFVVARSIGAVRGRVRSLVAPALVLVIGGAAIVALAYALVVNPSGLGGEHVKQATDYAPRPAHLFQRTLVSEQSAYPGAVIFGLAVIGVIGAVRNRTRRPIAILFAVVVVGAFLVSFAPLWEPSYNAFKWIPFIGFARTPGRILILAQVGLGVLVGFGISYLSEFRIRPVLVGLAMTAMVIDASGAAAIFRYTPTGGDVLREVPRGAPVFHLPPFDPGNFAGSRYLLHLMDNPGPRVGSYYVFAPPDVVQAQAATRGLGRSPVDACRWARAHDTIGFGYVAVHRDLFGEPPLWNGDWERLVAEFDRARWAHKVSEIDGVHVYRIAEQEFGC